MAADYELITKTGPIDNSTNTISFSSISQSYEHLEVIMLHRHNAVSSGTFATGRCLINNISSSNKYITEMTHVVEGNHGSEGWYNASSAAMKYWIQDDASTSDNLFNTTHILFPFYTRTVFQKNMWGHTGSAAASNYNMINQFANKVFTTSAITSLDFYNDSGSFVVGSTFWLYGIKG